MARLTIHVPDDVVRAGSPGAILRAMKAPPHVSPADVDDLDAAIAGGRLPVRDQGAFELGTARLF